ncbi:MAG: tRNA (adenosine(37)-N6)-threonylcarbamoyltransferase complex dimerization subunit type 1 TsaB [Acidobacteria bacterium]|nr:tRNA (adenosine(37)-N6)-threonylcarbamoyltransferase complex dimerization subunit type 1 TsaB [Acidobacteriota bacterium]
MILAIDTTHEFGSLALVSRGEVVKEVLLHAPDGFGQILFGQLARLSRPLKEIECFAAAAGPGSFTGVRIGLACVKGLAEACARPVVAVSNLEALAVFGTAPLRAVFLDARRGEIYGALYNARLEAVQPEVVMKFTQWLAGLPASGVEFITTGGDPFRAHLPSITEAPRALAGAVGRIAEIRFAAGLAADPAAIDANYVRRSDAELMWKE